MKTWTVYFEFLGKKMRIKVMAKTEDEARQELYKKLTIHKVDKDIDDIDNILDAFNSIFNGKL